MNIESGRLSSDRVWFGITPTLWWNDDFPSIDIGIPFEQCVSEMALAGFSGCSIGHKYPTDPAVLRAALELRGLRISEPWVSTYFTIEAMHDQTIQNVRQQLDFMDKMEVGSSSKPRADLVVAELGHAVHPLPVALFPNSPDFTDQQWQRLIDGLDEIGQIAAKQNRALCYHPHLGTGVMKPQAVEMLFDRTDPELVHMLLDTAHLTAGGNDLSALMPKYAPRIRHVHLKDLRMDVLDKVKQQGLSFEQGILAGLFTVPGNGSIHEFPQVLKSLAEVGFSGWLMIEAEQDPAKYSPLKYALEARKFLRNHLGW
jgi:inosose dehydratase